MLKAIKWILLAVVAVGLIIIGLANMTPVDLHLLPPEIGGLEYTLHQVPLFGVILAAIFLGLLLGYLFEWAREYRYRRTARVKKREADELAAENRALKRKLEGDSDMPDIPVR